MLKVKLNIEEIQKPEFIEVNEIQENNGMIIFPFYDNEIVQFIKLEKIGEFYELSFKEGLNENELVVKVKPLDVKWYIEAIEKFLEFNNNIIEEYEKNSLKETIVFLLNNNCNYYHSIEEVDCNIILRVDITSTLAFAYEVFVNSYGVVSLEGNVIDTELDKVILSNLTFILEDIYGEEMSKEDIISLFENMDEYLLKRNMIKGLEE